MDDETKYEPIEPSQKELDELASRISELRMARNRYNKRKLTNNQRLKQLWRVYDGALAWLEGALLQGKAKGTGAAGLVLDRARVEIEALERREGLLQPSVPQIQLKVDLSSFSAEDLETLKHLREKAGR